MPSLKKCKGTGKAKGQGCGQDLQYTERGGMKVYFSKLGLGTSGCRCFYNWFESPKAIKKVSQKRNLENKDYTKVRKVFLESLIFCQVKGCKGLATEVHHKKGRIGKLLTDTNYFLGVCRECHNKIELEPKWAKENGYSLNRLDI
jgi:hypothetical protein